MVIQVRLWRARSARSRTSPEISGARRRARGSHGCVSIQFKFSALRATHAAPPGGAGPPRPLPRPPSACSAASCSAACRAAAPARQRHRPAIMPHAAGVPAGPSSQRRGGTGRPRAAGGIARREAAHRRHHRAAGQPGRRRARRRRRRRRARARRRRLRGWRGTSYWCQHRRTPPHRRAEQILDAVGQVDRVRHRRERSSNDADRARQRARPPICAAPDRRRSQRSRTRRGDRCVAASPRRWTSTFGFLALASSDDDDAASPTSTTDDVLAAARRLPLGPCTRAVVAGDGGLRRGAGPLKLDFGAAVAALSSSTVSEREEPAPSASSRRARRTPRRCAGGRRRPSPRRARRPSPRTAAPPELRQRRQPQPGARGRRHPAARRDARARRRRGGRRRGRRRAAQPQLSEPRV